MPITELSIEDVIRKVGEIGIIPVVRAASVEEANRAVEAICAGGIPVVEITMTVPNAITVIRELVQRRGGDVLIGAGTVTNAEQAESCVRAGAQFLVSPGLSTSVLSVARVNNRLAIPGALTPTELMNAQELGARLIKIFPCGNLGGPKYLKSLKAPFPNAQLIPTGGVNAANAAEFMAAGAYALGVGADLIDAAALREGNLEKITAAAKELVQAVASARPVKAEKKAG
ncbi:MAG TPA: bifunctional 4-hydroxy-2-oxoglutarate aldolase/2-dehydro-3-deoxy-phosphogluconate aldolase [Candidatus Sulfotelmatobacter sp.]|jgi:2-dehydro-3-deoxyphosphogluconate aldolase/(4S)-4-hydroxy-2-oxoglutarate aldolase|nr:bifunctional 4-hydroxy-2-oxoglutarate aldolase/2-dehydro-3-deoxy-phosphogluconate aldolase [Candidatus Sulfotelmatobacter sp.]